SSLIETAPASEVKEYREISGQGVMANVKDRLILAGNEKLMKAYGIFPDKPKSFGTMVHVAVGGTYAGYIVISDEIKSDAKESIRRLKSLGIKHAAMLTGDEEKTAKKVAGEIGIDEYYANLLPEDKVVKLEQIQAGENGRSRRVAFVGDGINDAPVLTRADVGIAMGSLGADAAIEAADVVIMEDSPSKVAEAVNIARFTRKIILQNIILALGVKGIFLGMGAMGAATMWEAVFADVGVALLAVLNSARTLSAPELSHANEEIEGGFSLSD
ncbi:MAG: HAD-IC family P-type ATPase, partial [Firmicutes bacterium]|nr:HAD-IC family P-type ATPase [Bacillota bacterium]